MLAVEIVSGSLTALQASSSGVWRRRGLWRLLATCLVLAGPVLTNPVLAEPVLAKPARAEPRQRPVLAAVPIARTDLSWWKHRHEDKLKELRQKHPALIFLGDSLTQNWEKRGPPAWQDFAPVWDRYYGDRNAVNLGFVGDTTASLLWRIENGEVAGISPKVAVVLIGANNLGRVHWSADDTLAGIAAILHQLRQRLPSTRLLLLGMLPSERSPWVTETTAEINKALARKYGGDANDVTFLDVGHVLTSGSEINRRLFYDPLLDPPEPTLHPTAEGQARIAAAMEPTLARMLGDKPRQ